MGGSAQGSDDDELITAINVTPLVDIVLVLLIILMVTASYIVNKSINVDLPKAATGEATPATLSISIDIKGKLYIDGIEVQASKLKDTIRQAARKDPELKAVISADGKVRHEQVVHVIDLLRQENIYKFAINTSPMQPQDG